jgi:glycerol-3-phosphate dehydrogenase
MVKGFINVAGIDSPGLTSAPAIAEYVVKDVFYESGFKLTPKKGFNPLRKPFIRLHNLSDEKITRLIAGDSKYGNIVCRCETVSEAEIIDSIRRPAGARNIDAVKRRTRAGMGRCQGGFCTPRITAVLSRELGIPKTQVTKCGAGSELLTGFTKKVK